MKYLNWGFALMFGWLRLAGHGWNHKRVYRVYTSLKLNLRTPAKRKKIKRENLNTLAASQVGQGWSLDFLSDEVVVEKKTRILNVLDEYSRKCLLVVAQGTFKAKKWWLISSKWWPIMASLNTFVVTTVSNSSVP